MKKIIVLFAFVLVLTIAFVACSDDGTVEESKASEISTGEISDTESDAEISVIESEVPDTEAITTTPDSTAESTEAVTTEAVTTVPETTAPETTAPETTAPETTAPETTAPETTAPETEAPSGSGGGGSAFCGGGGSSSGGGGGGGSSSGGGGSTDVVVTGVALDFSNLNLIVDDVKNLIATISPNNATNKNVMWTTSNDSVVAVEANGKITAIGVGTAIITVTTADGNKTAQCVVVVSAKLCPHSTTRTERENELDSTCKVTGTYDEVVYCATCGDELSRTEKIIPKKTTHTNDTPVRENIVDSTCKDTGSYDEVVYCSVCGVELSRVEKTIDKKATHTPSSAVQENIVDSTCKELGSYDEVVYCSVCNKEVSRTEKKIDKKDTYTEGSWIVDKESTATETGSKHTECTICGKKLQEEIIPAGYTITWKNSDGTILKTTKCEKGKLPSFGDGIPTKASDSQYSYTFERWATEITIATEEATYVALYTKQARTSYTISYNANGGTDAPSSQSKNKGASIKLTSTIPVCEGKVFIGWRCANDGNVYKSGASFNINADVTLYAVWGHDCSTCSGSGTVPSTATCTTCSGTGQVNKTVDKKYICTSCNGNSSGRKTCTSCDIDGSGFYKRLYACSSGHSWYYGSYSSRYCPSCGRSGSLIDYSYCGTCGGDGKVSWECSSCSGLGYFWGTDTVKVACSTCRGSCEVMVTKTCSSCNGDKSVADLYSSYTVTLKNQNSTVGTSSVTVNSPYKLTVPTRNGYTFVGWFDSKENGAQYTDGEGICLSVWSESENKTLYARWNLNYYTITYDCGEDVDLSGMPMLYTVEDEDCTLNEQYKIHYTFNWKLSNKTIISIDTSIAQNIIIKGVWNSTASAPIIENRVEATCTEDGHYDSVIYCSVCHEELSRETTSITKLGHSARSAIEENRVEATCTEDGHYDNVVYCEICDKELSRNKITLPVAHNLENGVCTICGYDTYFLIYTVEQLLSVSCGDTSVGYRLMADLNLNGVEWTPIGISSRPFKGVFDGNGHVISNFQITKFGLESVGLFGYSSGTITNLGVEDFTINFSHNYEAIAGGLVGYNDGGTITNCYATGDIETTCTNGYSFAGGLVGYNYGGKIKNCYATGDVSSISDHENSSYAGGLVGYNNGTIDNCYATGDAYANSYSSSGYTYSYAGGLIGFNSGNISNCYAMGTVNSVAESGGYSYSPTFSYAGGLVGYNSGTVINSFAIGNVSSTSRTTSTHSERFAGGLVGYNSGKITNCYAKGNVTSGYSITYHVSNSYSGGLVGYNDYGTITNSYSTGNVGAGSSSGSNYSERFAGGLVGYNNSGTITNCYATGNVTATAKSKANADGISWSKSYAGGLVGYNYGNIITCYAIGDASAAASGGDYNDSYSGGLVGYNDSGYIGSSYRCSEQKVTASTVNTNGTAKTVSVLQSVSFQKSTLGWSTDDWKFVEGKHPTLKNVVHSWNEGVVTTEPTCNNTGVKTYTCTVCGETKTETIDKLSHTDSSLIKK